MLCITCQNFSHLTSILVNTNDLFVLAIYYLGNILTNTNDILKMYTCYLASALINTNEISKVDPCYLANILKNTNDKANKFTKEEVGYVQPTTHVFSLSDV